MKIIISSIVLLLICSLSANAQENKKPGSYDAVSSVTVEANKHDLSKSPKYLAYELGTFLELKEAQVVDLISLLQMKQEILSNPENAAQKKTEFMESFVAKIQASLDEKNFERLLANKELYAKLMELPEEAKK